MLKTEFPSQIPLVLGALAPPIKGQIEAQGLTLPSHEIWEKRHAAWNLLRIGGLLTDTEVERIARRLVKGIAQDAHFERAVSELEAEVAAACPASPAPEGEVTGSELDTYLAPEGGQ
jgi:hypothetical protein